MPVDNNDHGMIDGVPTDLRYKVTRDNWFRIVTYELVDCFVKGSI